MLKEKVISNNMNQYTKEQVNEHNSNNATHWISFHGYVYDVTQFINDHPGGKHILLNKVGTDVTNVLENVDAHVESWSEVEEYLQKFLIGKLV